MKKRAEIIAGEISQQNGHHQTQYADHLRAQVKPAGMLPQPQAFYLTGIF